MDGKYQWYNSPANNRLCHKCIVNSKQHYFLLICSCSININHQLEGKTILSKSFLFYFSFVSVCFENNWMWYNPGEETDGSLLKEITLVCGWNGGCLFLHTHSRKLFPHIYKKYLIKCHQQTWLLMKCCSWFMWAWQLSSVIST